MTRAPYTNRGVEVLLSAVRTLGHVSIRLGRVRPGKRWGVDPRDPSHITVYVTEDIRDDDWPAIEAVIRKVTRDHRRRGLVPVAELEDDETYELTGTDDVVDVPAPRLGIVREWGN